MARLEFDVWPDAHGPAPRGPHRPSTSVVVLTSRDCHLCDDAIGALRELAAEFPMRVRVVSMDAPEGAELVRIHRPAMPPAVLVEGVLFSAGRLPRKKLRRVLERTR